MPYPQRSEAIRFFEAPDASPIDSSTEAPTAPPDLVSVTGQQQANEWAIAGPSRPQRSSKGVKSRLKNVQRDSAAPMPKEDFEASHSERSNTRPRQAMDLRSRRAPDGRFLTSVEDYYKASQAPYDSDEEWLQDPEFPTSGEICPWLDSRAVDQKPLPINIIEGPWESTSHYLGTQHRLLREDTTRPLREAVDGVFQNPEGSESDFESSLGIYDRVYPVAITYSTTDVAVRVVFSLRRVGKKIKWEQSKRLMSGSIVALTPASDVFKTKCIIAQVAARPLALLADSPPAIDLFFPRANEIMMDPGEELLMIEDRSAYFEANRHTMLALQKLMKEPFPLQEQLVNMQKAVDPPEYLIRDPRMTLSNVVEVPNELQPQYESVDVLHNWPAQQIFGMDLSQQSALRRILTKRVAVIQGPPGTGKTHVSVVALKLMMNQSQKGDPPIIVSCQTNHALDQLLRKVAEFAPTDFIRLGGRSQDKGAIKKRTLFEVRKEAQTSSRRGMNAARRQMRELQDEMERCLQHGLKPSNDPIPLEQFKKRRLITETQYESLLRDDPRYKSTGDTKEISRIALWAGKRLYKVTPAIELIDATVLDFEEIDLEFEQVEEVQAEFKAQDDERDIEALIGLTEPVSENVRGEAVEDFDDEQVLSELQKENLWDIRPKLRGTVYNYLVRKYKGLVFADFRRFAAKYGTHVIQRKIAGWEADATLLKQQKLVGLTTTGVSKYRALLSGLHPKIILIEEAAETLEAPVTASCLESVEHLILVGDHEQLRPHCNVRDLEQDPYQFNISLFERLVINEMEYDALRMQRRMIPDIRRMLRVIYGKSLIQDHPSVKDLEHRPPIPGMGGTNLFFFTHEYAESRDELQSCQNEFEADMIVCFFKHLLANGMKVSQITVLTFYNAQRKLILRKLRREIITDERESLIVVTVDSYQGEENDVVILSLVRNNDRYSIGFLGVDNRVCVAISRAKRGFYMFGSGELLAGESKTWANVMRFLMGKTGRPPLTGPLLRIGYHLPIYCEKHDMKTFIEHVDDWKHLNGGCLLECRDNLPCGHLCTLSCHPISHEEVRCQVQCDRILDCGHGCASLCGTVCYCLHECRQPHDMMKDNSPKKQPRSRHMKQSSAHLTVSSSSDARQWQHYAQGGSKEHDAELSQQVAEKYRASQKSYEYEIYVPPESSNSSPNKVEMIWRAPEAQKPASRPPVDSRISRELMISSEIPGGSSQRANIENCAIFTDSGKRPDPPFPTFPRLNPNPSSAKQPSLSGFMDNPHPRQKGKSRAGSVRSRVPTTPRGNRSQTQGVGPHRNPQIDLGPPIADPFEIPGPKAGDESAFPSFPTKSSDKKAKPTVWDKPANSNAWKIAPNPGPVNPIPVKEAWPKTTAKKQTVSRGPPREKKNGDHLDLLADEFPRLDFGSNAKRSSAKPPLAAPAPVEKKEEEEEELLIDFS